MNIKALLRRLREHQDAPPPVTVAVAPTESAAVRDERVRVGTRAANAGLSADPALAACPDGTDDEKLAALAEIDDLVNRVVAIDVDAGGLDALSSDMQATRRVFRSPHWTAEDVETYASLARFDRREPVQPSGEVAFPVVTRQYTAPGAGEIFDRCEKIGLPTGPVIDAQLSHDQQEVAVALATLSSLLDRVEEIESDARDGGMAKATVTDLRGSHFGVDQPWDAQTVEAYAAVLDARSAEVTEAPEPGDDAVAKSQVLEDLPATHQAVLEDLVPHLTAEELAFLADLSPEDLEKATELAREFEDDGEVTELPEDADDGLVKAAPREDPHFDGR